jgi:hypothetical protein
MARTDLAAQQIVQAGLAVNLTAPTADGDVIDCGLEALLVRNTSGAPANVTVQTPATVDGLAVSERVVTVAAGGTSLIGPLPTSLYGQLAGADKGRAYVDYSIPASFVRALVKF